MHILLTNDDGIHASGLRALYTILTQQGHTVSAIAPIKEKSGASNSLSIRVPVKTHAIHEENFQGTAVEGTPTDCIKIGLNLLKNDYPDLVISGINAGENIGLDSLYSGTIAAAAEACLAGIPAIAVSRQREEVEPVEVYATHIASLIPYFDFKSHYKNQVININYPSTAPDNTQGIKVCPLSMQEWKDSFIKKEKNGEVYWWLSAYTPYINPMENTDVYFLQKNWITITPLQFDLTAKESFTILEKQLSSIPLYANHTKNLL